MNYANSGNCDIIYIPRCVGKVIICGIKACSRCNVCQPLCRGQKPQKQAAARQGIARPREHNQAFCNQHLQSAAHLPYHFSHKRGK